MEISYFTATEKGRRENNEDAVVGLHLGPGTYFFAVADGMGGERGGEIASKLALEGMELYLNSCFSSMYIDSESLKMVLKNAFLHAHQTISDFFEINPGLKGMGTTIAALLIFGDTFVWGNIGDSRLYIIRQDRSELATVDHNYAEHVKTNNSLEDQLDSSQYAHILTRVVDGNFSEPDIFPENKAYERIKGNMSWLLCSDGLIVNKTIDYGSHFAALLLQKKNLKTVVDDLIVSSIENGSTDNVSVILIQSYSANVDSGHETIRISLIKKRAVNIRMSLIIATVIASGIFIFIVLYLTGLIDLPERLLAFLRALRKILSSVI